MWGFLAYDGSFSPRRQHKENVYTVSLVPTSFFDPSTRYHKQYGVYIVDNRHHSRHSDISSPTWHYYSPHSPYLPSPTTQTSIRHAPSYIPVLQVAHSHPNYHHVSPSAIPGPNYALPDPAARSYQTPGRKRGLCIGINYTGQGEGQELKGCINDAWNVRHFLIKHLGFDANEVCVMTDDAHYPSNIPTRKNMLNAMRWLVQGAQPGDRLFFHYSGHGGQVPDKDGDEIDGKDEVIFPLDDKVNGPLLDDLRFLLLPLTFVLTYPQEMHDIMVKNLPSGCRLTALFDSCHSGTILDLSYAYSAHGRLLDNQITPAFVNSKRTAGDVISWSGCRDDQTSADTFQGGVAVGAMSYAFLKTLKENPGQTYEQLLASIRHILMPKYNQLPQLGSAHRLNMKHPISL